MLAENNLAEEIQLRIQNEMAWMEDMHTKEMDILQTNMGLIQDKYTLQSGRAASKTKLLETTIEHMHAKTEMSEVRMRDAKTMPSK